MISWDPTITEQLPCSDAGPTRSSSSLSGSATVERDDTVIAELGAGDVVGELSLIDRQPRTATSTATEECELLSCTTATSGH